MTDGGLIQLEFGKEVLKTRLQSTPKSLGRVINHQVPSLKPAGESPEEGPRSEDTRCATISGSASRIGCPDASACQEHRTTACLSMPCRYRAGIPWCDLPARFADFRVAHLRHSRWSHSGVWQRVFEALAQQAGNEYAMIGSTIVHKRGRRSRGGGCTGPPDFFSRQGRRTASKEADVLLAQTAAETVIADKGYDAQARVLEALSLPHAAARRQLGTTPRIFTKPPPSDRKLLCQAQAVPGHRHAV